MKIYLMIVFTSLFLIQACKKENVVDPPIKVEENFWQSTNCPQSTVHMIKECSNGFLFANTSSGILKSTDNGNNWNICLTRNNIGWAIAINNNDKIAIVDHSNFLLSSNYGETWETKQLKTDSIDFFMTMNDIAFDDEERIFIATDRGVLRSEDLGNSWDLLTEGMFIKNIHSVLITKDNSKIIAGANSSLNALYYSSDKGNTWTESENLTHQIIFALAEDSTGNLFAAGNNMLFHSVDKGISWSVIATANTYISDVLVANGNIFIAIAVGSILYSDDGSVNYKELNSGFDKSKGVCLHLSKSGYLFAGTRYDGIYRSIKPSY